MEGIKVRKEGTFEGSAFEEAEGVHAEFLEVLGEDELPWRMRAGEGFAVAGEYVDCFFGEGIADVFESTLCHASGGWEIC